ncbi:MAG TPA: hypothetical protein VGT05_04425 [Patescibacteria group bacterium]|nr:hypothetical protein [Patescibacteria group bacterium]
MRKSIYFLFTGVFLFFLAKNAFAQTVSLGITPTIFQINAKAPSDIKSTLTIINQTNQSVSVNILIRPFRASNNNDGTVSFIDKNGITGADPLLLNKVSIFDRNNPVSSITLSPAEKKQLRLHITIPLDEPPSDYYFSIIFLSNGIGNDQSSISALSGGIAANVLLSIGPQDQTRGTIEKFSTSFFKQAGPVSFRIEVNNQSSHYIVPRGGILISNMFNQTVGIVNLSQVNVLENSSRYIPDDKNGNTIEAIWGEKVLFGLYKATLTMALSSDGPVFQRTVYFLAVPAYVIFGVFFAVFIALIIAERVKRRMKTG